MIGTESDGGRPVANLEATLTAGSMFGGYRIESFLARGGMGVIYRATQLALQRIVALKVVAPELAHDESFRERFKREALLAASLDHPNILPIYEAGEIDGQLFLAMRLVVGSDLDSLIQREQALAPERAAAIVEQVASALDAAHGRGLVHRDVKPGNILIAEEYGQERAYLTDFGLTKNAGTAARLTKTGQMVGTLDYVAPEQVQGGAIDGRADSYALACVLYRAVTGRLPFDRPGDIAKMRAHLNDPPPSAAAVSPAVSSELDAVIRRGMAKRPEDRYASSGEFARAARSAAGQVTPGQLARPEPEATQIDSTFVGPRLDAIPEPASDKPRTGGSPEARGPLARIRARFYLAGALAIALAAIIAIVAGGGGGKAPVTGGSATRPSTTTAASTTAGSPLRTVAATPTTTTTSPAAAQAAVYHARVARIIPRLHAVFRRFPKGSDFGQAVFSRTALSVAAGLRGIADDLDALSPPAKILVDHEALVTHLHEMEQAFRSLAADSENRDFSGAVRDLQKSKAALARINPSVRRVQANR